MKKPETALEMKKPETALDKFRIQEQTINADVALAETRWNSVLEKQEKIQAEAKAAADKERLALEGMIADFEKLDAELEVEERKRIEARGLTKKGLQEGAIGVAEYFQKGQSEADVEKTVRAAVAEKLTDLRNVIRARAIRLLELEERELRAEWECWCASTFPAATMAERLKGLLKALEASMNSSLGNGPLVKTKLDLKTRELRIVTKGGLAGESDGWKDYDLAGLKRLRLNPTFPVDQLPKLEETIIRAKAAGQGCRLMINPGDRKNPIHVMWS